MKIICFKVTIQRSFSSNRKVPNDLISNGLYQLGSLIRWKKIAQFVKNFAIQKIGLNNKEEIKHGKINNR